MKLKIKIDDNFLTRSLISNPDQKSTDDNKVASSCVQDVKHKREWVKGENGFMVRVKKSSEDETK